MKDYAFFLTFLITIVLFATLAFYINRKYKKEDMTVQLRECFNLVRDSSVAAMAHYQIWFALRGEEKAVKTHFDDMNDTRYVDFFLASNSGNYKLMFIETACLFDSDEKTHNIRSLKALLSSNDLSELTKKFNSKLSPYTKLVSNIKTIRSRIIAHKEANVEPKELYKKHGIKPDDIKDLLNTVAELLGEVESKLNNNSSSSTCGVTDRWERATFNLLKALHNGKNSQQNVQADT